MRALHLTWNHEGKRFALAPGGGIRSYFEAFQFQQSPAGGIFFEDHDFLFLKAVRATKKAILILLRIFEGPAGSNTCQFGYV